MARKKKQKGPKPHPIAEAQKAGTQTDTHIARKQIYTESVETTDKPGLATNYLHTPCTIS